MLGEKLAQATYRQNANVAFLSRMQQQATSLRHRISQAEASKQRLQDANDRLQREVRQSSVLHRAETGAHAMYLSCLPYLQAFRTLDSNYAPEVA